MLTKAEADKRLFNVLFELIMPKIYQLQESPLETEQAQAVNIANALYRLYSAITVIHRTTDMWGSFCGETEGKLSRSEIEHIQFTDIHAMLNRSFKTYINRTKIYQENVPLSASLNNNAAYGSTQIYREIINELKTINFRHVFRPSFGETVMHSGIYNSIITVKKLCQLAKEGDLNGIKKMNFSNDEVDLVISSPWNSYTDKMTWYLGRFNALAVAVWYRRFPVIQHFLETGADVNAKVGRAGSATIAMCAGEITFFSEPFCRCCHEYILDAEYVKPDRPLSPSKSALIAKSIFRPPLDYSIVQNQEKISATAATFHS